MIEKENIWRHGPALLLTVLLVLPFSSAAAADYAGIPWGSNFPVLEQHYPGIVFDNENAWRVCSFVIPQPAAGGTRLEFKLFDEQLTAVAHKVQGPLEPFMNEEYLRRFLGGLGKRVKVETKKIPSIHGMTDAVLWDYGEIMVFFQTYPPVAEKDTPQPDNIIKFVHRPLFNTMMTFIKDNPHGDPDAISDDFNAIAF